MPSYTPSRPATPHPDHYILPSAPSVPSTPSSCSGAPHDGIYAPSASYPSSHSPAMTNHSVQRNQSGYQSPGRLYSPAPSVSSMERNGRSSSPSPLSPYARSPSPYYSRPQTPVLPAQARPVNLSLPQSPSRSHSSKSKSRPSPLRLGSPASFPTPHPDINRPMHSPPPRGGPFDPNHRPHRDEKAFSGADSDDSRRLSPRTELAIKINKKAAALGVRIVNDKLVFAKR